MGKHEPNIEAEGRSNFLQITLTKKGREWKSWFSQEKLKYDYQMEGKWATQQVKIVNVLHK